LTNIKKYIIIYIEIKDKGEILMISKDEVIALLADGATVEDLAAEITEALNAGKEEYEASQKAAKVEAARIENAKREAVCVMLDGLSDYLIAAGEEELHSDLMTLKIQKVMEMLDSSIALAKRVSKLKDLEFEAPECGLTWEQLFDAMFS
jgi:hypothetical protein